MSIVRIGDILLLKGARRLESDDGTRFTHYRHLALSDSKNTLEFETSPEMPSRPRNRDAMAVIFIPRDDIESDDSDRGDTNIQLVIGGAVRISFHMANPLTPTSGGFWFRLRVLRDERGYRIQFDERHDPNQIYLRTSSGSWSKEVLKKSLERITVGEWLKEFPLTPNLSKSRARSSAQGCVVCQSGPNTLVDADQGHLLEATRFSFRAAAVEPKPKEPQEKPRRFRAAAQLEIPNGNGTSPIATESLGTDDQQGIFSRPLSCDADLKMVCTSFDGAPEMWRLDWKGLPTDSGSAKNQLSFRTLWQLILRHHALGLRTLNAKSHLSFLPTDIRTTTTNDQDWALRFGIWDFAGKWQYHLESIYATGADAKLTFGMAPSIYGKPMEMSARLVSSSAHRKPLAAEAPSEPGSFIQFRIDPSAPPPDPSNVPNEVNIAGVLLKLNSILKSSNIEVSRRPNYDLGDPAVDIDLNLSFSSEQPRAVSEQPELGFEFDSEWLDRDRSLVFDLNEASYLTTIEVRERANSKTSRTIELLVHADQNVALTTDAVVIDPSPLRIARVLTKTQADADQNVLIATFRDDPERAMRWDFTTESGELDLILPPQSIGEEMIKGKLTIRDGDGNNTRVPLENELFDYRLSPSTWLKLDRTGVDTARAPAPWNLRRILGRREAEVGLELLRGEFELLYGLTVELLEKQGLRVAERQALLGRIPFPSDLVDAFKNHESSQQAYAKQVAAWIRSLLYHPSELPIFRNWVNRENLVINRGLEFYLRPTRQTSNPFRLEQYQSANLQVEKAAEDCTEDLRDYCNRFPLRGGVDYGFESPNIYENVLNNPKVDFPGRSQGTLSGVSFGALGGSGSQQALFDEGRTLIISTTTQGRLDTLTIVRVGRIAMLWNHSRHVIVYERSTRTAPRYVRDQPTEFEGLAALRKVKEFVEITQPHRTYPDGSGTERRSGPLVGSFFESITIPVRSQWGNDIDNGFVIPLYGPVPEGLEEFYPVPQIFLEFARAPAKGGKISQLVETPERLVFYSSTIDGEGSNTDTWRARADVDFPVTRRPRPPTVSFLPAFSGARHQPDAQQHEYGQKRFTVDVESASEAVNLVHGRPLEGIEARIRNVSIARGRPPSLDDRGTIEARLGAQFGEVEAQITDTLREIANHADTLARSQSGDSIGQIKGLRETGLRLVREARIKSEQLKKELASPQNKLKDPAKAWATQQKHWLDDLKEPWEKHLGNELGRVLDSVLDDAAGQLSGTENSADLIGDIQSRLRTALDVARIQTRERIERFAFVPQRALESLSSAIDAQQADIEAFVNDAGRGWNLLLNDLEIRYATEAPATLEAELRASVRLVNTRLQSRNTDTSRTVKDALGSLFQDLPTDAGKGPVRRLVNSVEKTSTTFIEWSELVDREVIPPFELGIPNWNRLRKELDPGFHLTLIVDEFITVGENLKEPFENELKKWQDLLDGQLDKLDKSIEKRKDEISRLVERGEEELRNKGSTLLRDLKNDVINNADILLKQIDPDRDNLLGSISNELKKQDWLKEVFEPIDNVVDVVEGQLLQRLDSLEKLLGDASANIDKLAAEAKAAAAQATGSLRNIGERIEREAREEVLEKLRDQVEDIEDSALEMVRSLAEGPVTDTLKSTRDWVGYYYDDAKEALDLTRTGAIFNDLGDSLLNGLSTQIPIDRIRDRLMPQLRDFDLNQLLPDFAGLKLEHLFDGVKIPEDPLAEYDWIDLRHGFDKDRLTAWSTVAIDRNFDNDLEVFRLEPLGLSVQNSRFEAKSRFEAGKQSPLTQTTSGNLSADWVIDLNGESILTIEKGGLVFDESGKLDFDFKPENLKIAPALQFITDALENFFSPMDGLTITPVAPGGVKAELSMPVPDIGTGAFTMTGITIYSHFDLLVAGGFEVGTGLWLSRPERPFGVAILFLGGGGWFGVDLRYRPPTVFETQVSIGLSAGAMIALNFGVAHGSAGILFTIGIDFYRNWKSGSSGDVVVSVGLLVWGEFSILAIASAYLRLVLRIEYRNGAMTGYGLISLRIKICWCFTLKVKHEAVQKFGGGGAAAHRSLSSAVALPSIKKAITADLANLDW